MDLLRYKMDSETVICALDSEASSEEKISQRWLNVIAGIRDEYLDETQLYPWVIGF